MIDRRPFDRLTAEERQARARAVEEQALAQRREDLRWLLSQRQGRRLWRWLTHERLGLQDLTIDYGVRDGHCSAIHTAAAEGRREADVALYQMAVELDPRLVSTMEAEHLDSVREALILQGD